MGLGETIATDAVTAAMRELGHDPYPWTLRDGYRFTTACRACGGCAEAYGCDGDTFASGYPTLNPCTATGRTS